jgi:hypothetical protein
MKLDPDFELLERIGILSNPFVPYLHRGGYQMEVEESDFKSLEPFLIRWGGGEALQELFFYQLNFVPICQPPKPQTLQVIQEKRTYFQSREKLEKMDFSQLQGIKLHFGKDSKGNGINADLPPDLVYYFGQWIKKELEAENQTETTPAEKLRELREIESQFKNSKLKIQIALPSVDAILKAKSPETTFDKKQIILCAYGIFYQRGHRLNFEDQTGTEPESRAESFRDVAVYDLIKSHLSKDSH